jgi:hypothetical protein
MKGCSEVILDVIIVFIMHILAAKKQGKLCMRFFPLWIVPFLHSFHQPNTGFPEWTLNLMAVYA